MLKDTAYIDPLLQNGTKNATSKKKKTFCKHLLNVVTILLILSFRRKLKTIFFL